MPIKLDILAFGVHPDDVELGASGTLLKHKALGKKIGIIDLTRGELGTRGSAAIRDKEAEDAAAILGIDVRENLTFEDGFFINDKLHQLEVIKRIRYYQPEIILCNAIYDRHPDHGKGSNVVSEACFYSGLQKIETEYKGNKQLPWRPKSVYHYIQFLPIEPDFVVDISEFMEDKIKSVKAYRSQFYNPGSKEADTVISSAGFLDSVQYRARDFGRIIGTEYAEGFTVERYLGVNNLFDLI